MKVSVPKFSVLMRWVGPAAIAGGVFMVLSDLSGLPVTIPYLSTASPSGFDAVGSGLILVALTLLLVGMVGLYARTPAADAARVIEHGEGRPEQPEEEPRETAEKQVETLAPRPSSRAGALVLGTGLILFFMLRR